MWSWTWRKGMLVASDYPNLPTNFNIVRGKSNLYDNIDEIISEGCSLVKMMNNDPNFMRGC